MGQHYDLDERGLILQFAKNSSKLIYSVAFVQRFTVTWPWEIDFSRLKTVFLKSCMVDRLFFWEGAMAEND